MNNSQSLRIPGVKSWSLAVESLVLMETRRINATLALSVCSRGKGSFSSADLMAARRLIMETTRRQNWIDRLLNFLLAPRSIRNLGRKVRAFLRLYVYCTRFDEGNSEAKAVAAARTGRRVLGWRSLNSVEEILGRIIIFDSRKLYDGLDEFEVLGLETYHPTWFVRYCVNLFGKEEALRFLATSVQIPPSYLRVNTLKMSTRDIESVLKNEGIIIAPFEGIENVYEIVQSSQPPIFSSAYREGLFYLQDPASCLAVQSAEPESGWKVLDVCAAPGGKTSHLAQLMGDKGRIVSIDISRRRLRILKREVRRGGTTIADAALADAFNPLPVVGEFDLVVLDPPCSGTGTFWKTPSAKWRIDSRSFKRYSRLQGGMIDSCSKNVKLGGFLVYSTCSISLEENELVIEEFLKGHPEFQLVETRPSVGKPGFEGLIECQRLYPHTDRTNGFFLAKMQRVN